ncbi:MAG TPA: glutathione S-transferase family protein [Gemmatimonadota bacterium]|nr:glutathione S-transferase family protein [Gemmatimonadota bacterium]
MRKLLEFHRSPNAVKVRVALNYKGLDYVTEEMMAADRRPMIEAAGWPLIPILLDGDVVMRDSAAILHYLEANYRDGPALTPSSRDDIRTAEALLANLSPGILRAQWSVAPEIQKPEGERDLERIAAARRELTAALDRLEERFAGDPWLVGGAMSIYDVILACNLLPIRPPARFIEQSPIWRFFDAHLRLEDRPNVAAWVDRVAAYDSAEPEKA